MSGIFVRSRYRNTKIRSAEVYFLSIVGFSSSGRSLRAAPELALPHSCNASGAMSAPPLNDMYVSELVSGGCCRILMLD